MLKPAICYKEELEKSLAAYFYTDEMMLYQGHLDSHLLSISDCGEGGRFQFAVLDSKENLIGYISYWVDYYSSRAYGFGAFSFEKGKYIMAKEMFTILEELLNTMHAVEFRAVSGNPAIRGYDKFLEKHANVGKKLILSDVFKDKYGNYRDEYIYEFIN